MNNKIECSKCRSMATVVQHVTDADELARVGLALSLGESARPYFVIECPNCGQRIVEADVHPLDSN